MNSSRINQVAVLEMASKDCFHRSNQHRQHPPSTLNAENRVQLLPGTGTSHLIAGHARGVLPSREPTNRMAVLRAFDPSSTYTQPPPKIRYNGNLRLGTRAHMCDSMQMQPLS